MTSFRILREELAMQMDPSHQYRRAHLHAGDLLADAERRRMAKASRAGVSHRSSIGEARLWVGAAFVRFRERLRGTVTALPAMPTLAATDMSTIPDPQSAD